MSSTKEHDTPIDVRSLERDLKRGKMTRKEYDKALAEFDEAIRLDPKCTGAYGGRAISWRKKGEPEKAEKDFAEFKRLSELKK